MFPAQSVCYAQENPMALIIVDENLGVIPSGWEYAFELRREEFVAVLADVFDIAPEDMDSMELAEIIDVYGEPWQINEIRSIADTYYTKIAALTDSTATFSELIDSIRSFAADEFIIDMIFILHSNGTHILFSDGYFSVATIVESIQVLDIPLRALYQTCCYASMAIPTWEICGISAVNGSNQVNSYVLLSPIWFTKCWLEGMPYDSAVYAAYQKEIDSISTYETVFPEITFMLSEDVRESSAQNIGGILPNILWTDFYSQIADFYAKPQQLELDIFPNPFNSSCVITAPSGAEIEIYDLRGNVVVATPFDADASLSPLIRGTDERSAGGASRGFIWQPDESIPSGIYLVRARTMDGQEMTRRIIYLR